jgi:hypothetical protein
VPKQDRRQFLRECSLAAGAAFILSGGELKKILIESESSASRHRRMAERELLRGLTRLQPAVEINLTTANNLSSDREPIFRLRVEPGRFKNKESFSISARGGEVTLTAATDLALLYAVSYFLERQGAYFGIDGESYPPELAGKMVLPAENHDWESSPRFAVRGLLPWPDFLNCISVYNDEDFQAYFEAMLRMSIQAPSNGRNRFSHSIMPASAIWLISITAQAIVGATFLSAFHAWAWVQPNFSRAKYLVRTRRFILRIPGK